ncbi:MAG: hypothetical protein SGI98_08810 [Verrucomicrobiota bacterium]|nr:hypothetical protein [Verrucomicrobiota bacterium]
MVVGFGEPPGPNGEFSPDVRAAIFNPRNVQYLGVIGSHVLSYAYGANYDGTVVVGHNDFNEAYRWTQGTGMQSLWDVDAGTSTSIAYRTSADGTLTVG